MVSAKSDNCKDEKNWPNSACVLKLGSSKCTAGLDAECEKEKRQE